MFSVTGYGRWGRGFKWLPAGYMGVDTSTGGNMEQFIFSCFIDFTEPGLVHIDTWTMADLQLLTPHVSHSAGHMAKA